MPLSSPSQRIASSVSSEQGSRSMGWVSLNSRTLCQLSGDISRHTVTWLLPCSRGGATQWRRLPPPASKVPGWKNLPAVQTSGNRRWFPAPRRRLSKTAAVRRRIGGFVPVEGQGVGGGAKTDRVAVHGEISFRWQAQNHAVWGVSFSIVAEAAGAGKAKNRLVPCTNPGIVPAGQHTAILVNSHRSFG